MPNKVLVIASDTKSLVNFRWDLLQALRRKEYEVHVLAPRDKTFDAVQERLHQMRVSLVAVPMANTGLNPLNDLCAFWSLWQYMKHYRPEVVLSYTIKPVIYGSMAAALAGVPCILSMLSGLGHLYTFHDRKTRLLRQVANRLYRWALRFNRRVFFQNPDDRALFLQEGLVKSAQAVLIPGSGVNLEQFPQTPLPVGEKIKFLFAGRLIKAKGIYEFIQAVALLEKKEPEIEFRVVGGTHHNPAQVDVSDLKRQLDENGITYFPETENILPLLQDAHVVVLPSYREGVPKVLLEALSVGRLIVTTDVPGCRQVVQSPVPNQEGTFQIGTNGFLVPPYEVKSLSNVFAYILDHRDLLQPMALSSRHFAESQFDVDLVNAIILSELPNTEYD